MTRAIGVSVVILTACVVTLVTLGVSRVSADSLQQGEYSPPNATEEAQMLGDWVREVYPDGGGGGISSGPYFPSYRWSGSVIHGEVTTSLLAQLIPIGQWYSAAVSGGVPVGLVVATHDDGGWWMSGAIAHPDVAIGLMALDTSDVIVEEPALSGMYALHDDNQVIGVNGQGRLNAPALIPLEQYRQEMVARYLAAESPAFQYGGGRAAHPVMNSPPVQPWMAAVILVVAIGGCALWYRRRSGRAGTN